MTSSLPNTLTTLIAYQTLNTHLLSAIDYSFTLGTRTSESETSDDSEEPVVTTDATALYYESELKTLRYSRIYSRHDCLSLYRPSCR